MFNELVNILFLTSSKSLSLFYESDIGRMVLDFVRNNQFVYRYNSEVMDLGVIK